MNITRALSNDRLMKAITGMSALEFESLARKFERAYERKRVKDHEEKIRKGERGRQLGGGRKGKLVNACEKLFFYSFLFQVLSHI